MTGLDYKKDKIIEIAVLITNGNLDTVDEGINYVIRTDKAVLDSFVSSPGTHYFTVLNWPECLG